MDYSRPLKVMIHDAYGIFTLKRDGGGGDPDKGRNWAIAKYVWAGRIMAAVESQPEPYSQILQFCYAPEYRDKEFNVLNERLLFAFLARHEKEVKQHRTELRIKKLVEAALHDYRLSTQGRGLTIEAVCEFAGLDRSNFYKHERQWRRWYQWLGAKLHKWELEARKLTREALDKRDRAS